ncbi:hypothetical protein [Bacillus sp. V5-8f]|uniref:hypothetical protein n=1 Tax=Bacillus sp. V5-8f TaxID=2053044 RepID=UPI000C770038|nr:hypothetical protein [Bacillus sp. V5-8f]PLT32840.1 hypothetical protein CUU64_17025 [Bacillus sp. V5-8f]
MKKHSLFGKVTFWLGFLSFIFGIAPPITGTFKYSEITPNQSMASTYIGIAAFMILSSSFLRKEVMDLNIPSVFFVS